MNDRLQLEAFADGAMSPADAAVIAQRLRSEPALRAELAEILRVDALARQALLPAPSHAPTAAVPASTHAKPHWRAGVAAAAALVLIGGLAWSLFRPRPLSAPIVDAKITLAGPVNAPSTRPPLVVLAHLSLPGGEPPMFPPASPSGLDDALAAGDSGAARETIREGLSRDEAQALAERLGTAIRSARTAHEALDGLTPGEQLALCEVWARDPRWRPVAFERLARLKNDDTLGAQVVSLARTLAQEPGLASWVRSYRLIDA